MFINTVKSLADNFTEFKRLVHAYVWAYVKEYVYAETEETYKFIFRQFVVIGEDEAAIKDKAYKYLRSLYSEDAFVITNIIPYREELSRELRKDFTDVLEEICATQYN